MTSTVYELTRTARNMGDFNPVAYARTSTNSSEPPVVKTLEERRAEEAERRDAQPQTVRCGIVGCDWPGITGTVAECREASRAHRELAHPELVAKVTRRRDRTIAEKLRAGRERRFEDRPAAGDIIDTPTTGADENFVPEHGGGTTQHLEEGTMTQKPRGYWTLERIVEGFKRYANEHGEAPTTGLLCNTDRPDYLPSYPSMTKVGTYAQVLEAAGLEKPKRARQSIERAVVPPLKPEAEPTETRGPTRTDRALKLVDAARAVDDCEAALSDARAEYDRLVKELAA